MSKPPAIIVDVDGTLADVSGIRHHVRKTPARPWKDFDAFHAASVDAPANFAAVAITRAARDAGIAVLVVTARRAVWRNHTAWFLALNDIPSDALFMRATKDGRPDVDVKRDILARIRTQWTPVLAVDDNPAIVALWRSEGIPTVVIPGWED